MTDQSWPELSEHTLELWLAALGDRELNGDERQVLLEYLELHPQHWRACALALWDSQVLSHAMISALRSTGIESAAHFAQSESPESVVNVVGVNAPSNASSMSARISEGQSAEKARDTRIEIRRRIPSVSQVFWAISCAVLGCLLAGSWWTSASQATVVDELSAKLSESQDVAERLTGTMLAERSTFRNLAGVFPDRPCLIEIENTGDRVVYLADGPVPEDLLRGLVQMGQVKVQPYRPDIETPLWKSLDRPIVAIEVDKLSSLLVAQGDSL